MTDIRGITDRDRNVSAAEENISFAENHLRAAEELIKSQLDMTADTLGDTITSADDIAELYCRISGKNELICGDFAYFCKSLSERNDNIAEILHSDDEDDDYSLLSDADSAAYVQNSYTDMAYRLFSRENRKLTVSYYASYREICENVYNGISGYAIIPVFNSDDGNLVSFFRLMNKYELKICLACDVMTGEESFARYALIKKRLADSDYRGSCLAEINAVISEDVSLSSLLSSFETVGAYTESVNTIPVNDAYGVRKQYMITLNTEKCDVTALRLFLEGSQISYSMSGIYKIINRIML